MKHSLASKGLSLSQAQSISNLCNQRCRDIQSQLNGINNSEKVVTIDGKDYIKNPGVPMPAEIIEILQEKSQLHATQAFLMENIKAKDAMLQQVQRKSFVFSETRPETPDYLYIDELSMVDEAWGWEQLTEAQWHEYLEAEAYASHIGQFIHRGGKLDQLREELPGIELLEWLEVETGKRTPVEVNVHHSIDELGDTHESLSAIHRKHEQRVNYFKAMVKNSVTNENARRIRVNADEQTRIDNINQELRTQHNTATSEWSARRAQAQYEFNEARQREIERIAALRIQVPARFQPVVDEFLNTLE